MGRRNHLVEGPSGAGKTSVAEELQRRGFHVVHGDRELAYRGDPVTGLPVEVLGHETHLRRVDRVRELVADRTAEDTFFCGGSRNWPAFVDLFDTVVVLRVDRDEIARRLERRPPGEWGHRPEERALVLQLLDAGGDVPPGVAVDAGRPLAAVVDAVLAATLVPGVRPARTPGDAAVVARLWATTFPDRQPLDVGGALRDGRTFTSVDPAGAAVLVDPVPDELPQRRLTVLADSPGAWSDAERGAAAWLRATGVEAWHVVVREDDPAAERLAAAGYRVTARSWGAALRASSVDRGALLRLVDAARSQGYEVRRLRPADAVAAHDLVRRNRADFPVTPATPAPAPQLEEVAAVIAGERSSAHGALTRSGDLVAVTTVEGVDDDGGVDVGFTVVSSTWRRRGLATAVKALSVLDHLDRGATEFRTGGAQVNAASLAANRALGFVVEPLWLTWTTS